MQVAILTPIRVSEEEYVNCRSGTHVRKPLLTLSQELHLEMIISWKGPEATDLGAAPFGQGNEEEWDQMPTTVTGSVGW